MFFLTADDDKDGVRWYFISYMASAWGCGHTVPLTGEDHQDRRFGIRVNFYKDTGKVDEVHYANFGADTTGWQYLSDAFVAKQDYDRIYVGYWYQNNANPAYFTGLSLFKEAFGASFTYDEKGNAFTYTYDDKHNVKTAKSAADMNYAFTYDSYGHPLTSKVVNPDTPADAKTAMTSKASYTASGQYMAGQTDALGNKTVYSWDEEKGLLNNVTDAGGHMTAYTYDSMDRITKVSGKAAVAGAVTDVSVQYGYEKDRLTKITHNGFDYVFAYDGFGKRTKVSVAGTALISHSYEAKNGLLTKSTYGNGWEISYSYDSLDRLVSATARKDGVPYPLYSHIYNKQGQLARFIDSQEAGKSCSYGYDVNDCLTEEQITTAEGTRTIKRTYDADSREEGFTCGTAKVDVAYDKLGRLSTIKRNGKHTTAYTYQTAPDGGQTGQIAKVTNGSEAISYTYDARGYVTSAVKDGKTHRYQYDALGQLIREEDPVQGKTIVYLYDGGGNLKEKRVYALTTAADLTGLTYTFKTFTYGSTWKDQLTAVYTYDAGGIRTSKTVNGVKTEYLTANGKVLSEKKGSTWQHYLYDGSGNLAAIRYKGADYYYVRDGLMNITGLVDGNGNTVVNYSYDSWGKILGVSGSMAGTLGQDNPYRYKGYYYDAETGYYYVSSRYYDPEIGRFISADSEDILAVEHQNFSQNNLYTYCWNNPVNMLDETGTWPNWVSATIGVVTIAGLAVATAMTGGTAAIICGAALSGSIAGGGIGAGIGFMSGGIEGAFTGFAVGSVAGGVIGAASAAFNIGTGATTIVNKAHGSTLHKMASNIEAGKMAASGRYSKIGLNTSLKKMGLNGGLKRPDVTGIAKRGANKIVEVVSPRQSTAYVKSKMAGMKASNPGIIGKVVTWVRKLFR